MPTMTVRTRIVASMLAMLIVTCVAVVGVVVVRTSSLAREQALEYGQQLAERHAADAEKELTAPMRSAGDLASAFSAQRSAGHVHRDDIHNMLAGVLGGNPSYLGTWVGWEPNAVDGADRSHVDPKSTDATGRFLPYWHRTSTGMDVSPLADYDTPGAGDYYLLAKNSKAEKVVDPYEYDVEGKKVLMTSLTAPVVVRDTVVGVAGIDIALSTLQEKIGAIKPYASGYGVLVTGSGSVVAHPDAKAVGKTLDRASAERAAGASESGRTVRVTGADPRSGEEALQLFVPVQVGANDTWTLVVSMPMEKVLAESTTLRNVILAVAVASLLVAGVVAFWLARQITAPIDALRRRLDEIANGDGDLTQRADDSGNDEIGRLAAAFNLFAGKIADTLRAVRADASSVTTTAPASARSRATPPPRWGSRRRRSRRPTRRPGRWRSSAPRPNRSVRSSRSSPRSRSRPTCSPSTRRSRRPARARRARDSPSSPTR